MIKFFLFLLILVIFIFLLLGIKEKHFKGKDLEDMIFLKKGSPPPPPTTPSKKPKSDIDKLDDLLK